MGLREELIAVFGDVKKADDFLSKVQESEQEIFNENMINRSTETKEDVKDETETPVENMTLQEIVQAVTDALSEEFTEAMNRVASLEKQYTELIERVNTLKTDVDEQVQETVDRLPQARLNRQPVARPTADDKENQKTLNPTPVNQQILDRRKSQYAKLAGDNKLLGGK